MNYYMPCSERQICVFSHCASCIAYKYMESGERVEEELTDGIRGPDEYWEG